MALAGLLFYDTGYDGVLVDNNYHGSKSLFREVIATILDEQGLDMEMVVYLLFSHCILIGFRIPSNDRYLLLRKI